MGAAMKLLLLCLLGMIVTIFGIVYYEGFTKYCFQGAFALLMVVVAFFLISGQLD